MNREEKIKKIKKDIKDYKKGTISRLPLTKNYAEEFNCSHSTIKNLLSLALTKEEKAWRLKLTRQQTGKEVYANLSDEKKKAHKERYSKMAKRWQKTFPITEEISKLLLQAGNWKVMRLYETIVTTMSITKEKKYRRDFLYEELKEFLPKNKKGKQLLAKLLSLSINGIKLPDFICRRGNKIKFVEVKSGKKFNPNDKNFKQKEAIKELGKIGYSTEIRHIPIEEILKETEEEMKKMKEKDVKEILEEAMNTKINPKEYLSVAKLGKLVENVRKDDK
ncbi:hypothetical protein ACFLZZ_01115 [Nanoarchaeota archaeon]